VVSDGTRQYVSFELDGGLYGFDIQTVKEVNPSTHVTFVPRSPPHIRGLVNIRGQVVLVIDIAVLLGRGLRPITSSSQVVILKTCQEIRRVRSLAKDLSPERFPDKPVGFLVDRIGDVVAVEEGRLQATPPHLDEGEAKYVQGVVHLDNRLLVVLNAVEML
jgi:purine-binding chemotaxis protein CheW